MEHLGKDLAAWSYTSTPENMTKEAGCRELISSVLLAAAIISGGIEVCVYFPFCVLKFLLDVFLVIVFGYIPAVSLSLF